MADDPRPRNEALREQVTAVVRAVGPDRPRRGLLGILEGHQWTGTDGRPVRVSRPTLRRWLRAELGGAHV